MRIVIFGLAKSGTTALFYILKSALPPSTLCLFEPRSFNARTLDRNQFVRFLKESDHDVLAKVLPFRPHDPGDAESFSDFEKQILIVRDPRDRLISRLLYGIYHSNFYHDNREVTAFLEILYKESESSSYPCRIFWQLSLN